MSNRCFTGPGSEWYILEQAKVRVGSNLGVPWQHEVELYSGHFQARYHIMVVFLLWRQLHPRFQATQNLVSAPFQFLLSLSNVFIVVVTECPGLEEVLIVIVVYSFMLLVGIVATIHGQNDRLESSPVASE